MFLHMRPGAQHVNGRNGLYYRLDFGARGLTGQAYDVDMAPIIAPSGDANPRPIGDRQLELAAPQSHWLPRMQID